MSRVTRGLPDSSWDHDLFRDGGHFMQSGAWMAVQQALGDEILHCAGQGWRFSAVLHRGRGVSWLYAPYGPALQDESRLEAAVGAVRDAGRELGVDFVRVEPDLVVAGADVVALRRRDRAGEDEQGDEPQGSGAAGSRGAQPGAGAPEEVTPALGPQVSGVAPDGSPWRATLRGLGAVRARPVQPRHTLVLDLRRSEEDLRADLLSGRRRSINAAARKGISVRRTRESGEVEQFIRLIGKTGQRSGFEPHSAAYYRTLCQVLFARQAASLYLAEVGGEAVAAVIAFESPTTGYYAHAADDPETSRQIVAAAPLAWRIVLDCRAAGRSTFDFWGVIPDDSGEHAWAGFSRFKKTFGGRMLTRPGTFDLPLRPLRYRAYRTLRELRAGRGGPAPP